MLQALPRRELMWILSIGRNPISNISVGPILTNPILLVQEFSSCYLWCVQVPLRTSQLRQRLDSGRGVRAFGLRVSDRLSLNRSGVAVFAGPRFALFPKAVAVHVFVLGLVTWKHFEGTQRVLTAHKLTEKIQPDGVVLCSN